MIEQDLNNFSTNDLVDGSVSRAQEAGSSFKLKGHVVVEKTDVNGNKTVIDDSSNFLTTGGIDWVIEQLYQNATAGDRGANFLALSNHATGLTAAATAFTGEITTGGLARVDLNTVSGGITNTDGTSTIVLTNEFTASAAITGIKQAALFYGASQTQPINIFVFTNATTLQIGERLTVTWTVSITTQ